ncbi:putative serine/threonine protein kinase ENV7 [Sporobolomyces salmoneus]|uniref:putative serine/threonine protein kinase ENV7 n=1 Tax=Sporobolomyces salmoneus TaxID=183962 RepID=UPI0031711D6A
MNSILDAFYALIGSCCKTDATLKLNGRSFKILKLLGEGGFSYVYLAQDQESKRLFALKKIRCPLGSDSVKTALKEVEAYKRFRHENIIRCLDSCVVQDREGDGKIIYLFLPYYKNATVQHVITSHLVNGTHYPESQILHIFLGTCRAVKAMHQHNNSLISSNSTSGPDPSNTRSKRSQRGPTMKGKKDKGKGKQSSYPPPMGNQSTTEEEEEFELGSEDEDEDDEFERDGLRSGDREGEALIGGLEATRAELAEATAEENGGEERGIVLGRVGDRSETGAGLSERDGEGGMTPWAHRDIKPANIMISDDGVTPILMDFGSALPARIEIRDRRIALMQQDLAAEHCSMPFRAPELFDVKTGTTLTESVDIWSLGCTLYAMAYSTSPFETSQESSHGGSIAMAVMNGKYSFPSNEANYSQGFKEIVKRCLVVKAEERPGIDEVIQLTETALSRLQ